MNKYGFELLLEKNLEEAGGCARLWRHLKTGAELLSIANSDENKCFGVSFYTPPTDSTGVSHILEHSVLCGSRKYPVKEPFAELLKGSLQTFLNAFTFPDKTCYPVASANLQDFYNLMDVYLDAVFHPLLAQDTFRQEGWHVEAESADGPWTFKGVVYNEMKGVYSSPDSVLAEQSQQAVFPDNLYCLDSGGNPEHIPDLTYQAFQDFHNRYYHPGNARFFFWGDDPEDARLERIAREIDSYGPVTDLPRIAIQKQPAKNVYVEKFYAAGPDENRAFVTLNWLLPPTANIQDAITLEMLEHILEGLPGSPLRRALMESGLGEDTTGCGLETDLRQMYYSTGLKGIRQADAEKVEALIFGTLKNLAGKGIDAEAIEAAVNSVEFAYREDNSGRFPRGLAAMILSLSTWLYGGDPLAPLAWADPIAKIKADLASGKKVFEDALGKYFLKAPYTRVLLLPDRSLARARAKAEEGRLAEIQAESSPAAREELVKETERLQLAQLAPDSPEDLAKIPALGIKDLPEKKPDIPSDISTEDSRTFILHDLPTRGIGYCTALLPLPALPPQLIPLLPLFSRSLTECGSAKEDYSQLGMKIAAKTGGLGASFLTGARLATRQPFCYLTVSGKAVYDKLDDLFALFREILLEPQKNADILRVRLAQMSMEARARLEYALQTAGNAAVSLRLGAHFSGEGALAEQMGGINQLEYLRAFAGRLEKDFDSILIELEQIRNLVIASQDAIFACAAESAQLDGLKKRAEALFAQMPKAGMPIGGVEIAKYQPMRDLPEGEAFITDGSVNFVGKGANLYAAGYEFSGSANVILRLLRMGRLWEEVRVAGGAYGVSCSLDRISGAFICSSFRDPNINSTLAAYNGLGMWLRNSPPSPAQVEQAIVGAVGAVDAYLLPDARATQYLAWYLAGNTPEMRQKTREQMLNTSAKDFQDFADTLDAFAHDGDVCVLGGAKAEKAAGEYGWKEERLIQNAS